MNQVHLTEHIERIRERSLQSRQSFAQKLKAPPYRAAAEILARQTDVTINAVLDGVIPILDELVADIRLGVSYAEFNMVTSDTLVRAFFWFLASERFSDTRA